MCVRFAQQLRAISFLSRAATETDNTNCVSATNRTVTESGLEWTVHFFQVMKIFIFFSFSSVSVLQRRKTKHKWEANAKFKQMLGRVFTFSLDSSFSRAFFGLLGALAKRKINCRNCDLLVRAWCECDICWHLNIWLKWSGWAQTASNFERIFWRT